MLKYNHVTKKQWATSIGGLLSGSALISQGVTLQQIDLSGNQITGGGGNALFSDLDSDGSDDFTIAATFYFSYFDNALGQQNIAGAFYTAGYTTSGYVYGSPSAVVAGRAVSFYSNAVLGNQLNTSPSQDTPAIIDGWIPAQITSSILGTHEGFIQVRTNSNRTSDAGVSLLRFVYDADNPTTAIADRDALGFTTQAFSVGTTTASSTTIVPEPSSLALLAMGAGGLILRRKRKQAA